MTDKLQGRRRFLRSMIMGAATLPLLRSAQLFAADALPHLDTGDATAKALGYIEEASKIDPAKEAAFKKGSTCANCNLYLTAQEKDGYAPCSAFPGKAVSAKGWCRAWVAKA